MTNLNGLLKNSVLDGMEKELSLLPQQIGIEIINGKKLQPIHSFYRFKVFQVHDVVNISTEQRKYRLHYQIEGTDLKVVIRFYLNSQNEIFVKYYRTKGSDAELCNYLVEYWIQYLRAEKKFGNKILVNNLAEF